jgi:hypothetical protein
MRYLIFILILITAFSVNLSIAGGVNYTQITHYSPEIQKYKLKKEKKEKKEKKPLNKKKLLLMSIYVLINYIIPAIIVFSYKTTFPEILYLSALPLVTTYVSFFFTQ